MPTLLVLFLGGFVTYLGVDLLFFKGENSPALLWAIFVVLVFAFLIKACQTTI